MKSKKRNKVDRAFTQGFKAGVRGHEMEACPFETGELRGLWYGGWREGRSTHISGNFNMPENPVHLSL